MHNSLALFERGAAMLREANTIQKAKELRDMAIVAGEWARRKKMGEQAVRHCTSYALEAERKMGEMLAETELQHGARGIGKSGVTSRNSTPTLAGFGISKRESAEAQWLAAMPKKIFKDVASGKLSRSEAKSEISFLERVERRRKLAEASRDVPVSERWSIHC